MYAASQRCVAVLQLLPEAGGWRLGAAARLRGHRRLVSCLDVEAGWVVTGSADKTVRLWRPGEDGGCSYSQDRVLEGHFLKVRPGSCSWCGVVPQKVPSEGSQLRRRPLLGPSPG